MSYALCGYSDVIHFYAIGLSWIVLNSIVLNYIALHWLESHNIILSWIISYRNVLRCAVLQSIELCCIVSFCCIIVYINYCILSEIIFYCTALYCIIQGLFVNNISGYTKFPMTCFLDNYLPKIESTFFPVIFF